MYVQDKTVLITGGASGIGSAIVKTLLEHNVKGITIADVNEKQAEHEVKGLQEMYGPKVIFVKTDITKKHEFEEAMKKTVETFKSFDILINNAGIGNEKHWESSIDVNFKGTYNGCLLAMDEYFPKYKSSADGVIVNMGSIFALSGFPVSPTYVAAKHAILGLGKCLASPLYYEHAKVKILTICPGYTDTPIFQNMEEKILNAWHYDFFCNFINSEEFCLQKVEVVSKALVKILDNFDNGSVWVVSNGDAYEVRVPALEDLQRIQTLEM